VALHVLPSYGFTNHDLRELLAQALGLTPDAMTQGKMSYHLRRLRLHGLIERIDGTHRYLVTDLGLRASLFLTRAHTRLLVAGLAEVAGPDLHMASSLRHAFDRLDAEMDRLLHRSRLAA
jgi:DNA-binding transcriptional ArsR family regulator